jgi:hypothetical protein
MFRWEHSEAALSPVDLAAFTLQPVIKANHALGTQAFVKK